MLRAALAAVLALALPQGAPANVVVGRVVDPVAHSPVSYAIVTLQCRPEKSTDLTWRTSDRVMATDDGQFAFTQVAPGACLLEASKPGYLTGSFGQTRATGRGRSMLVNAGESRLNVEVPLWRYGSIAGVVADESGEPIVALSVLLFRDTVGSIGGAPWTSAGLVQTDDRGAYSFPQLSPGHYLIAATAYGQDKPRGFSAYATTFFPSASTSREAIEIVVDSGDERHADIRVHSVPTARVDGTLALTTGQPASGGTVDLWWADDVHSPLATRINSVRVDASGHFKFPTVPAGRYLLTARVATFIGSGEDMMERPGAGWAAQMIDVGSRDAVLSLALRPYVTVSGRTIFDGKTALPTASTMMAALYSADGVATVPSEGSAEWSPATGTFTIRGRSACRCVIESRPAPPGWAIGSIAVGDRDVMDLPVDIDADLSGVTVTLTDRPASLSGAVRTPTGELDLDAAVLMFSTDPNRWPLQSTRLLTHDTRPDERGRYAFASLVPGDYFVVAVSDAASAAFARPEFLAQLSRVATRVHLDPGSSMTRDLTTMAIKVP